MSTATQRSGLAAVKLIPLEVLLGNPERAGAQISPDGRRVSYLAPLDGVLNVFVGDVGAGNEQPVTRDTGRGIAGYLWAQDNCHLMYMRDKDGSENFRLYDVNVETGIERDLTPLDGVQCRLIAHRKRFPNEVLLGLNHDNPELHDVYHLDLTTGALEKIVENPGYVGWVVDDELQVRGAVMPMPDGATVIMVRDDETSDWRPLLGVPPEDAETTGPVGFTKDGAAMYLQTSVGSNTGRLVKLDIVTGGVEVIAEDPSYDITNVFINPDSREVEGVVVYADRQEYRIFDSSMRLDVEALQQFNRGDLVISARSQDNSTWLVAFDSDSAPVKYYTWDRATKEATFLFDHRPELAEFPLVPMEPFAFTARDGLRIHGYLSFPAEVERCQLPAVLVVHGGPWTRDGWGLDPEAQWIANRGYACVHVNFRGSSGYGKEFLNAGDHQWGAKMHDDLLDAIDHLVAQGLIDRRPGGNLRRILWRVCRVDRCELYARCIQVCDLDGRPVQPEHTHRLFSCVLEADDCVVAQAGRCRPGLSMVTLTAVEGRRHQDSDSDRSGGERPACQSRRVRADRRGYDGTWDRP